MPARRPWREVGDVSRRVSPRGGGEALGASGTRPPVLDVCPGFEGGF